MEPAVSVQNLTKTYPDGKTANNSITLDIDQGTIFAILGPNGAGKTTFVRQITTELLTTSGSIHILGIDARSEPRKAAELMGVVPQQVEPYGDLTVYEHVYYFARLRGLSKSDAHRDTDDIIAQLGLSEFRDRLAGKLSGGLKRRTIVATALTGHTKLLVLDEPSTGLDPVARRSVWAVLRQKVSQGKTVVLTTHYVDEAEATADKVAIFRDGRVIVCDKPENIRSTVSGLFRLTVKREENSAIVDSSDPLAVLHSMGLTDMKSESDGSFSVRIKAEQRNLLPGVFDWAVKSGFVVNISPITLEDAYLELIR